MKKYIIANWKSNKDSNAVREWFSSFEQSLIKLDTQIAPVVVAPPFPLLDLVDRAIKTSSSSQVSQLMLATQDLSSFSAGSYTGAVSTQNLMGLNVKFAIVGHSERRRHFHETHQDVANKVTQCLEAGITPIVCVDDEYITDQASAIAVDQLDKCIVAYEELGSIGTGNNESPTKVAEVIQRIKVVFGQIPVLYGGSVKPENVDQYVSICDGVLVGGASLDPVAFAQIIHIFTIA